MKSCSFDNLGTCLNQELVEPIQKFLREKDFSLLASGKYYLEEEILAIVIKTASRGMSNQQFEAHRKYLDLHCLISGKEVLAFTNAHSLSFKFF
ncbi:YhcH/YjgK/YiaL family protein [Candidatus Woesearchaeota archaeon]|nr:YhcH/YjgK/YiaL family protein [Candidatus Woesearchaeota archaeon]